MANIALGKLPIEKDKWKRPELATDGIITGYSGHEGFASSPFPISYTLDLESEKQIKVIRFLLWDAMGQGGTKPDRRKYRFTLSISNDGINYILVYTNQTQEGGNGWYSFEFLNFNYVRYIKLECLHNTENEEIHIVEFEVHDAEPPEISSTNHQKFPITTGLPSYSMLEELVQRALGEKTQTVKELEEQIKKFNREEKRIEEILKKVGLFDESKTFTEESVENGKRAGTWLFSSCILLLVFIVAIYILGWKDEKAYQILCKSEMYNFSDAHSTLLLSFYYLGKATIISVILFALGWTLKNYRSERHNYVINRHKSIALKTATGIMINPEYNDVDKKTVFTEVLQIVFSHQNTGYSKDEQNSPSVVNTLMNKKITEH